MLEPISFATTRIRNCISHIIENNDIRITGAEPRNAGNPSKKGFEEPTPIQSLAIPKLLASGSALAARARTGTGKTAAFGIPLVESLSRAAKSRAAGERAQKVSALILVPTRELAIQVTEEISTLKYADRPTLTCVYGGASITKQFRALKEGVDIVVGTPGRVLDHMERGTLDISAIEYLVLDEADEMLDMGFIDDITKVMDAMNPSARIMLFSGHAERTGFIYCESPDGIHRNCGGCGRNCAN